MMTVMTMNNSLIEEAVKAGTIYGHRKTKTHPRMKSYVVANRNEIEILDVEETVVSLNKAVSYLEEIIRKNGLILLVSIKPSAYEAIEKLSQELNFPKVTSRWLGGTLTNFSTIRKRIEYYQELCQRKEGGGFEKYTKKERHRFEEEIQKLGKKFSGLLNLTRLPDCLFIIDPAEHQTAVREARHLKIPIVAIVDTDDDPALIDYPIIANDHAKSSIDWIVDKILEALKQAKSAINESTE